MIDKTLCTGKSLEIHATFDSEVETLDSLFSCLKSKVINVG